MTSQELNPTHDAGESESSSDQLVPVAQCACGYLLLDGQPCPECGRPFEQAWPIAAGPRAYIYLTVASLLLPFCNVIIVRYFVQLNQTPDGLAFASIVGAWLSMAAGMVALTALGFCVAAWYRMPPPRIAIILCVLVNGCLAIMSLGCLGISILSYLMPD